MDRRTYVCCIVRRGIATSASTHSTKKDAVKEAKACGEIGFSPDHDDIAVIEVDSDGACLDRVFAYTKKRKE